MVTNEVRQVPDTGSPYWPVIAGDYVIYMERYPSEGNGTDVELTYYHIPTGESGLVTRDNVSNYIADADGSRILYANLIQINEPDYTHYQQHWRLLTIDGIPKAASILAEVDPPQGPPPFVTLPNGIVLLQPPPGTVMGEYGVLAEFGLGS